MNAVCAVLRVGRLLVCWPFYVLLWLGTGETQRNLRAWQWLSVLLFASTAGFFWVLVFWDMLDVLLMNYDGGWSILIRARTYLVMSVIVGVGYLVQQRWLDKGLLALVIGWPFVFLWVAGKRDCYPRDTRLLTVALALFGLASGLTTTWLTVTGQYGWAALAGVAYVVVTTISFFAVLFVMVAVADEEERDIYE